MKAYGTIYKITNKINGKSYVGLTTKSLSERFEAHWNRATKERSHIQNAMKKYGKDNFEIEALYVSFSKDDLYQQEVYFINKLNTFEGFGYNLTKGGGGITEMSEKIRSKISKSKTGKKIKKLQNREITHDWRVKISRTLGGEKIRMFNKETGHEIILDYLNQSREYGFSPGNVCSVLKGIRNHTKGYSVEYANPDRLVESNDSTKVQRIASEPANAEYNLATRSRLSPDERKGMLNL
jgi:group I intron endonuclease